MLLKKSTKIYNFRSLSTDTECFVRNVKEKLYVSSSCYATTLEKFRVLYKKMYPYNAEDSAAVL